MNITLSLRGNAQIVGLFELISEQFQHELSRSEIIKEAINYALSTKNINWQEIVRLKNAVDFSECCSLKEIPSFLQLRVNAENWTTVSSCVAKGFNPPLKKLQTPFLVKVILLAYWDNIQSLKNETKKECILSTNSVFDVSEIIKDFIDMAMYGSNSTEFVEIVNLIKNWKEGK